MSGTVNYEDEEDLAVTTLLEQTEATMLMDNVAPPPQLSVRAYSVWSLWRGLVEEKAWIQSMLVFGSVPLSIFVQNGHLILAC